MDNATHIDEQKAVQRFGQRVMDALKSASVFSGQNPADERSGDKPDDHYVSFSGVKPEPLFSLLHPDSANRMQTPLTVSVTSEDGKKADFEHRFPRAMSLMDQLSPQRHDSIHDIMHSSLHGQEEELSTHISALYGILVTMTGFLLAVSSTLTTKMDPNYARWYDFFLMAISILWISFAFLWMFRQRRPRRRDRRSPSSVSRIMATNDVYTGSFYLKLGATMFAVGAVIYSCMQLGVFIENRSCFGIVMGLNPCISIIFILLQLYFIFKNSQFKITKFRAVSRFGLAHLIATDLCIWMRTLIDETMLEFDDIEKAENKSIELGLEIVTSPPVHTYRAGALGYNPLCVNEKSAVQEMMSQSVMFLFPCIIEYALICAGIMFVMWKVIGQRENPGQNRPLITKNTKVFTVDCSHAANGLFAGILVMVLTIVGLIVFMYVHKEEENSDTEGLASWIGDIMDVTLNVLGLGASIYCGIQFATKLQTVHIHTANMALDDGLLLITMIGVYGYSVVWLLGTYAEPYPESILDICGAALEILQSTAQTVFLFDASKRVCVRAVTPNNKVTGSVNTEKPAREMVMFLLATNFAQWTLNVLLTLRADAAPGPREFYGAHQWAVLLHATVPLTIFYRFHSTVCLFDIWKRAYKIPSGHDHGLRSRHHSMFPEVH
ncbi:proton channel OtopLc-like [Paramacrobiotus metropolitanus]|uniref:proton channel OtopLc-like n=1 Tax=Paramacrobiotus metropolitanus TaxID=2943436 RepID=UPI0024460625|nr:proton channel OtopLc-like [Paramacrobiotus metropolitanus]